MTEPTKEPSREQIEAWHQEATGGTKTLDLPHFAKLAFAEGRKAENEALREKLDACAPYLKEGETPADRIQREIDDNAAVLGLLAKEKKENEALRKDVERLGYILRRVIGEHCAPNDCYSTGPITGTVADHVCPSCEGLKYLDSRAALQEPKP